MRRIFTIAAAIGLLGTLPAGATELVAAKFLTSSGQLQAHFQLSGDVEARAFSPTPSKVVVEIEGLCIDQALCPEGATSALRPLYRFDSKQPIRQLNVVDLGTGKADLIFRLRRAGIPWDVESRGDTVIVAFGAPHEEASAAAASRPGIDPRPRIPAERDPRPEPATRFPVPSERADTRLSAPDPQFLAQDSAYRIGAGDRLNVVVFADERLTRESLEVAPTGYVDLPLIGALPVAGHSVSEVEKELERLYEEYLKDPDVSVVVDEYNSQWVNVIGAVGAPGRIYLKGRTTLMDALSEVEGVTDEASGTIVVHRRGETKPRVIQHDDLFSGRPGTNIFVHHGDTINVEMKRPFYVSGEVRSAGQYDVEPGMTVLDALARAGGLTEYAKEKEVIILRDVNGERERIVVNPKAIERGKDPNIEILPGDHIKVPGSFF